MRPSDPEGAVRRGGIGPLVRPSRSQAEVDLLPPYGDPEVSLAGELGTYLAVGAATALAYAAWRHRRGD